MWGKKPPELGQARKDREASKRQPLHDSGSADRNRNYTEKLSECPYCGSTNITGISSLKNGDERGRCNSCYTSISTTVGTEYYQSALTSEQRNLLRECAREGMSIRETAKVVGVNRNTAERYFKIFEEKGGKELEAALEQDAAQAAHQQLQQELLDEQD